MPNTLGKNLNLCFTKIKLPLFSQSPPLILTDPLTTPDDHSCPSTINHSNSTAATSILIRNFNSLYEDAAAAAIDDYASKSLTHSPSTLSSASSSDVAAAADFAAAAASRRFFFSTPGRSNSIVDSSTNAAQESDGGTVFGNSVAVPTFSPDPYVDFRRSMQEMVEARELTDLKSSRPSWEFLHELLLCYLALNPKSTHKFIIGAFADLLVSIMPSPPQAPPESVGRRESQVIADV